jgi:hypothetical protein
MHNEHSKKLHRINNAAWLIDASRNLVYDMMSDGRLKYVVIGNTRFIPDEEIQRIVAEGAPTPTGKTAIEPAVTTAEPRHLKGTKKGRPRSKPKSDQVEV